VYVCRREVEAKSGATRLAMDLGEWMLAGGGVVFGRES
jgi:hypothetical protein